MPAPAKLPQRTNRARRRSITPGTRRTHPRPHRPPSLLASDLSDTRTQARVRRILQGYTTGGQQSLFCCWLTAAEYRRLLYTIPPQLDPATDRLHIFRVTEQTETRLLGKAKAASMADAPLIII